MRFLRPATLIPLESGLWLIDEFQPVAAILDPRSGDVRDVVTWSELPPAPTPADWPGPTVMGDGTSLWAQQHRKGPVVRIGPGGIETAVWTRGLQLAACGPGEGWCAPPPPSQELVQGVDAHFRHLAHSGYATLLRVHADGRQESVMIDRPVRSLHTTPDALVIRVDDDPGQLRHLGVDDYEVVRASRYLSIPWGSELPGTFTVAEHGHVDRPPGIVSFPHDVAMTWYSGTGSPRGVIPAAGARWRLGRVPGPGTGALCYPVLATAHDATDRVIRSFELGSGSVVTARPIADDTAVGVAVRRRVPSRAVEVISLRPDDEHAATLLPADAIDISDRCWPLAPRPLEADSYAARILAANSPPETDRHGADGVRPVADGISDATTSLDGTWPDTHLQWTFRWPERPGLILRRRVPLYDELGRPVPPEYASIHLMEDLDTHAIPPASAAHENILDI